MTQQTSRRARADGKPTNTPETAESRRGPSFQLRGLSCTMMALRVEDPRDDAFVDQLRSKIGQAPNFFRNAPIVLDLEALPVTPDKFDLDRLIRKVRALGLVPVGVQNAPAALERKAIDAKLAIMPAGRSADPGTAESRDGSRSASCDGDADAASAATTAVHQGATMIVSEPVRSGQQIYAPQGDLIVLGPVSAGAELLADGSIHVYNALRGRALAGVSGDTKARIFCRSLEAELVSISGIYEISERLQETVFKAAAQVSLDGTSLRIEPLP